MGNQFSINNFQLIYPATINYYEVVHVLHERPPLPHYCDAIIMAVAHNEFKEMGPDAIRQLGRESHVLYDIKYILNADEVEGRL